MKIFNQSNYWIKRHKKYINDPRSVGNLSHSLAQNIEGERIVQSAMDAILGTINILKTPKTSIDLGCGYGRVSCCFTDLDYDYTGLDVSSEAIDQAKDKNPAGKFLTQDLLKWEPKLTYDVVCSLFVFVHFVNDADWRNFLINALSCVDKNGLIIIADEFSNGRNAIAAHVVKRPRESYIDILKESEFVIRQDILDNANGLDNFIIASKE